MFIYVSKNVFDPGDPPTSLPPSTSPLATMSEPNPPSSLQTPASRPKQARSSTVGVVRGRTSPTPGTSGEQSTDGRPPTKRARKAINCEPCRNSKLKCDRFCHISLFSLQPINWTILPAKESAMFILCAARYFFFFFFPLDLICSSVLRSNITFQVLPQPAIKMLEVMKVAILLAAEMISSTSPGNSSS